MTEEKKKEGGAPKVYSPDLKIATREEKDEFLKILDKHYPDEANAPEAQAGA